MAATVIPVLIMTPPPGNGWTRRGQQGSRDGPAGCKRTVRIIHHRQTDDTVTTPLDPSCVDAITGSVEIQNDVPGFEGIHVSAFSVT